MKIVVTGGGSGGHIIPILAVAQELKRLHPGVEIIYIGQKGDPFAEVPANDPHIDSVRSIAAGKFRRYHTEGLKQLLDVQTVALNLRDGFRIIRGTLQSIWLLARIKPAMVFTRGGYVSVPVAIAAHIWKVPFITHDSDSIPSLANRLIARWAAKNAVALPADIYPYDQSKTVTVGVPVMAAYTPVTAALKAEYRQTLNVPKEVPLLFVIGGGQGAQRINDAMVASLPSLLRRYPTLQVMHVAGQANESAIRDQYASNLTKQQMQQVTVYGYLNGVHTYSGAADVIITRAGASSIADFAVQGKACVVVPNPYLTAGHQLKNASFLEQQGAAELVVETDLVAQPTLLETAITRILDDPEYRRKLERRLATFAHPQSAEELARLVLSEARSDRS